MHVPGLYNLEDTICAQSTPSGRGGIHVIRVSGPQCISSLKAIFPTFNTIKNIESHHVYYGFIVDPKTKEQIDEVLVTYFKALKSFTAEETVEISCHGNPVIVREILNLLISQGCRLAERGEFTYRAFKNGRISLPQAEAVLSLIDSNSSSSVSKSLSLLKGDSLLKLQDIQRDLTWVLSRLEARIDFSTEDIEVDSNSVILQRLKNVSSTIKFAVDNYKKQSILDRGIKTLIVGPPNAGKSSLFNLLVGSNRSIVSSVAGTTRDYISESLNIHGAQFELIDTAGIRLNPEEIELLGISKVNELIEIADFVLVLFSPDNIDFEFLKSLTPNLSSKPLLPILNKVDLLTQDEISKIQSSFKDHELFSKLMLLSVPNKLGLDLLLNKMASIVDYSDSKTKEVLEVVSLRQSQAMELALVEILQAEDVLMQDLGDEFVLSHLNRALKAILSMTYIENDEMIRDLIFKDFCLGK